MAKEYKITLNNRLTECDLLVYSMPYRDGITAVNRMVLESCVTSYVLQKFIAFEAGNLHLISHIDKMIAICLEKLSLETQIDFYPDYKIYYALYTSPATVTLQSDLKDLLYHIYQSCSMETLIRFDASTIIPKKLAVPSDSFVIWHQANIKETAIKSFDTSVTVEILAGIHESLHKILYPAKNASSIFIDADFTKRRYRILGDLDIFSLDKIDNLTLDELSYIDV